MFQTGVVLPNGEPLQLDVLSSKEVEEKTGFKVGGRMVTPSGDFARMIGISEGVAWFSVEGNPEAKHWGGMVDLRKEGFRSVKIGD